MFGQQSKLLGSLPYTGSPYYQVLCCPRNLANIRDCEEGEGETFQGEMVSGALRGRYKGVFIRLILYMKEFHLQNLYQSLVVWNWGLEIKLNL